MNKIGIIIETKDGEVKDANYGMITCAAKDLDADDVLIALMLDGDPKACKEKLQAHGISSIVDLTSVGTWNPVSWSYAVLEAMKRLELSLLFGLTSAIGRELLPRIAAKLDAPLTMNCIDVSCRTGIAKTYLYSGKTLASIQVKGANQIYGIRPNVVNAAPLERPLSADIVPQQIDADAKAQSLCLMERIPGDRSAGDLQEADIIISGGRGMQNGENFSLLHECAKLLNAEVGASRVAVDLGWVPYRMQVGQTGEKVSPRLYIACGLSGSVQHFAGMKMSKMIIAINGDPNAAIVSNCDYFIQEDLLEVLPALNEALKKVIEK